VPASAFALALAAAFVHALWNLLIARARDPEAATAVALIAAIVVFAPVTVFFWDVEPEAWPYIAGTSAFHLAYFGLLAAAYRRAELSIVYPLARGVAPVLILVVSVAAFGVATSAGQAAGVCLVGAGVLLVRGLKRRADRTGVLLGLGTALTIAGYTLVDNQGVEHANPIAYLELTTTFAGLVYATGVLVAKGSPALRREVNGSTVVAGLAMFGAYALVLAALQLAAAAPVAAVRETSIVIATAGAALFLKERFGPARMVGAVLVVLGIALLGF
jgi:drug/metabolite transporter (DMT)-like permease